MGLSVLGQSGRIDAHWQAGAIRLKHTAPLTATGDPFSADSMNNERIKFGLPRPFNRKPEEGSKNGDRDPQKEIARRFRGRPTAPA
jgi:hypothetical protein